MPSGRPPNTRSPSYPLPRRDSVLLRRRMLLRVAAAAGLVAASSRIAILAQPKPRIIPMLAKNTAACATSSTRRSRRGRQRPPARHAGVPGAAAGGVAADGRCEFVEAFAKPYPSLTIAHVLGAPLEDAPRLHHWSNWIQRQFDAASLMNERERIEQACVEAYAYLDELLAARREAPGEDVISALLAAEDEGNGSRPGSRRPRARPHPGRDRHRPEPALARRPPAGRTSRPVGRLRERPDELAGPAVEEALRYEPVTPFTARTSWSPSSSVM